MTKPSANLLKPTKDLAALVKLEYYAKQQNTPEDLYQYIVNQTRHLVDYEFAALWLDAKQAFVKVSDVEKHNNNAPIMRLLTHLATSTYANPITPLKPAELKKTLAAYAKQYLFKNTLIIKLQLHEHSIATLILSRDIAWQKNELVLLEHLRSSYALCLGYLHPAITHETFAKKIKKHILSKKFTIVSFVVVTSVLLLWHVPLTVLAPAEVSSLKPVFIRSAIDGVIETVHILPNTYVSRGQKLISLNKDAIEAELNILEKRLALASTEHKIASKSGLNDNKQKQKIPILQMQVKKNVAEIQYQRYLLEKATIHAPKSGLILFDHTHKLEGKPVQTGENIMTLSDKSETALDIYLPVADAVNLKQDTRVKLFLDTSPRAPLGASIAYASYQAEITPEGVLAYHIRAIFDENDHTPMPRIGLRGVAKLYGDKVPLLYYLLRKPLSFLRQKIGI